MAAVVDAEKCSGCSECVEACPCDAIVMADEKAVVGDDCSDCAACVDACPNEAIDMAD